ncbi:hypothetical protein OQA88_5930 [Cercophora sp. LCS_1]
MTGQRTQAEETLRNISASPINGLELMLKLKDAWSLSVVGGLWTRAHSSEPPSCAKFFCNLAAAHSKERDTEDADEAMKLLVETDGISKLLPTDDTASIKSIYDFFVNNEKTRCFSNTDSKAHASGLSASGFATSWFNPDLRYARHAAYLRVNGAVEKGELSIPAAIFYDGLACVASGDRVGAMAKWKGVAEALSTRELYNCAMFQLIIITCRDMALLHRRGGAVWDEDEESEWVNIAGDGLAIVDMRGWDSRGCSKSTCQGRTKGVTRSLEIDAREEISSLARRDEDKVWEALCNLGEE